MKKTFFVALLAMFSAFASAQVSIGVHTLYGTEVENLGLGIKGRYDFTDHIRGEANFNYYFKKHGLEFWDINANAHYLFPIGEKVTVYPLAGIGYVHVKGTQIVQTGPLRAELSTSDGKFGFNAGGGMDYQLTEDLYLNAELKYQVVSGYNQGVFSVGLVYKF